MHNPLVLEMIGMCTVVLDVVEEDGMTVGGAPAAGHGMVATACALASYHSWERRNNKAPKSFMIILFVCLLATFLVGGRLYVSYVRRRHQQSKELRFERGRGGRRWRGVRGDG